VRRPGRHAWVARFIVHSSSIQATSHFLSPHVTSSTNATPNMAPSSRAPFRSRGSRSVASSRGNRSGNGRRTSGSTSLRRSAIRSASTATAGPSRSRPQPQRGPFADGTSTRTPTEFASHDGDDALDGDDDTLGEVIMAVDLTPRETVGCCYYVARDEKLYFMEDIQCGDVDVVDTRKCNVPEVEGRN
jgi:DNA mismatch repair protein MSH5